MPLVTAKSDIAERDNHPMPPEVQPNADSDACNFGADGVQANSPRIT